MSEHYATASASGNRTKKGVKVTKNIYSDKETDVQGPLEVTGSVQCMGSVNFQGNVSVRGAIEAYGMITTKGHMVWQGQVKAHGNIMVNGYLSSRDKIIASGKLRVEGVLEGNDLEIYGNVIVIGSLTCRRLIVYGALTLIGPHSSCFASESTELLGPYLTRDSEADWDF
ncbi:uncharacterized protein TRIREDRAFT_57592 [Trichoderma reesei QM6a]|uniref:Predicted protein n=2 Tax=Hypocrea jecorina TaxID=51453 RepID=G0RCV9_HYPJQ|nr:uncharacterized protein TRIREDRAFT_57592 [Trichoderma reesei QM6a]EGR50650.1 predicted protein [Trichoderma reesei QM6a]ETS05629.1 hypothetical protein M419DRAFT_71232 [Trichoderma reesei RUT C-30]